MYGTVARIRVKPGQLDNFQTWAKTQDQPEDNGVLLVYQADDDPNALWMVVAMESREQYRAVAESPEQHESFLQMMKFLEAEPEWHDGKVIESRL